MWDSLAQYRSQRRKEMERLTREAELVERLKAHPPLLARVESILSAVENEAGAVQEADAAEQRLIDELRQLGRESLTAWAQHQVQKTTEEARRAEGVWREGKKLCWHSTFGDIAVDEPQLRCDSHRLRPFVQSARVHHRGCSRPLQRAVTDFAADVPFAQAMDKLVEHYGVLLGESTIRRITEAHARRIHADTVLEQAWPTQAGAATVIVEMDGGMAPLVEPVAHSTDHRKYKQLRWQEAKLCLAHAAGSTRLHVGGTLQGDVDDAGQHLFHCARQAGLGVHSRVHAVGDGASWISAQVEVRFGAQGEYLVDFYHVCEYLGAAAAAIEPLPAARAAWLDEQKQRLKTRCADAVLATLAPASGGAAPRGRKCPGAPLPSLPESSVASTGLSTRYRRWPADWFGRNRKCAPLHRAGAPEAPRRLVARRQR
jgi:hypothetical protein